MALVACAKNARIKFLEFNGGHMTDMITWILKKRTFSEKEIREIIERDLPEYHLKKRPTKKGRKVCDTNAE